MYRPDRLQPEPPATDTRFTLAALVAWLRTKEGNETYCWTRAGECLFAQYGEYLKLGARQSAYLAAMHEFYRANSNHPAFQVAWPKPWTFSAALARAARLMEAGG
jgi:hypothetical protein